MTDIDRLLAVRHPSSPPRCSWRISLVLLGCALWLGLSGGASAQRLDSTVSIGQSERIWSKTLQEERRLLVSLPPDYQRSNQRYPVLYLLDAEAQFHSTTGIINFLASQNGRIPEMIVVGVTNTKRARDLTPPAADPDTRKSPYEIGGADAFLTFLTTELTPWVEANYRTQPYRILVGHSFGGLFAVHTLLTRPDSYQAYIAISPSLWWDKRAPVAAAKAAIGRIPAGRHYLRLTWGDNENTIRDSTTELVQWLEANPPAGVQWSHRYYPGDDHGTTPHRSLYDGLEALFADWRLEFEIDDKPRELDLAAVEAHYARLSEKYGFLVKPTADAIGHVAGDLTKRKEHVAALELRRRNVRDYPWEPGVYAELGDVLAELNRPEEARRAYEQALQLQLEGESPYQDPLDAYREKLKKLAGGNN